MIGLVLGISLARWDRIEQRHSLEWVYISGVPDQQRPAASKSLQLEGCDLVGCASGFAEFMTERS